MEQETKTPLPVQGCSLAGLFSSREILEGLAERESSLSCWVRVFIRIRIAQETVSRQKRDKQSISFADQVPNPIVAIADSPSPSAFHSCIDTP